MLPNGPNARRSIDAVFVRRLLRYAAWVVAAALVAVGALQWLEPVGRPTFDARIAALLKLPGVPSSLPWPRTGEAALTAVGAGSLGSAGGRGPVPISSVATVMTALVVLRQHPLAANAQGPTITVTAPVVDAAEAASAAQERSVPVVLGERLTERQALEAMLVAQGADVATMLADWDAGSVSAFVRRMNAEARTLHLTSTSFADPAGLDPATTSTAKDLVRLGVAAMSNPALAAIVALPQVTLPVAGVLYSDDFNVTHDGVVGIEVGASPQAGGCDLFAVHRVVDGEPITLVGAVLGQQGVSVLETVLAESEALADAAFAALHPVATPFRGSVVGDVVTPWGATVAVRASVSTKEVLVWPGLSVPVRWTVRVPRVPLAAGTTVGELRLGLDVGGLDLSLRTLRSVLGPSPLWRLTRA